LARDPLFSALLGGVFILMAGASSQGGKEERQMQSVSLSVTLLYAGLNALILLTLAILAVRARLLLHGLGAGLTASRLAHAQGIYSSLGNSLGRLVGTLLVWAVYLVGGGACLYYFAAIS
jgi:uncharacterized membrane protein YecN with MAPEG domain